MRDVSLGQYYAVDSVIHRLDARCKLVATIVYITMVMFITTFLGFGIVLIFILAVALLAKIPLLKLLRSLRPVLFLLVFTLLFTIAFSGGQPYEYAWSWWIFNVYPSALMSAGLLSCRLIVVMLAPSIMTLATTPVDLSDALTSLLKPLSLIKIPVHELGLIMSIALRMIPSLSEETSKIINAQKARGADFESANLFRRAKSLLPILIPLFISALRRANELADAMDSRCYRGAKGRTRMKVMRFKLRDVMALLLLAILFFGILILRYDWWNWLGEFGRVIV